MLTGAKDQTKIMIKKPNKFLMMMKSYDESVEINRNANWPYILDNPYRTLIISSSGSGKTKMLLNLINKTSTTRY